MNRIKFEQYSIVSPTATDALKYYNYYLMDTIFIDDRMVYILEVEPKNETDPLVTGTIDIADSTFNIVGVEGGLGKGIYLPIMRNFHYSQRFNEFQNRYWMPTEIHTEYTININFPVQRIITIKDVASLYNYNFNCTLPKGTFDYALEVAEKADDIDSMTWNARQIIPLTPTEKQGYKRIDSLVKAQNTIYKKAFSGLLLILKSPFNYNLFHFNRVEGAYLGLGHYWYEPIPRTDLDIKVGYAFSRKYWQQRFGVYHRFWDRQRLYMGIDYRNEIRHRPVILASYNFNPTTWNLCTKDDPYDYYLEKGFRLYFKSDLNKQTKVLFIYHDYDQTSEVNNTDYSLFHKNKQYSINPSIADGKLRSVYAELSYDSRPQIKIKGRDAYFLSKSYTSYEFGVEIASPNLINNDFDFIRYHARLKYIGHTLLPGITTFEGYAGWANKTLPPQKYFTIDYSYKLLNNGMTYRTVGANNFTGNRVAALYLSQNFGRWLFRKSSLPLVKLIPFSLSINGGVFWTDFRNHTLLPDDQFLRTATKPYMELGFSIGRIPPLFNRVDFTWQLSDYNTNNFNYSIGFEI